MRDAKKQIKTLAKELDRNDKALVEMAALPTLKTIVNFLEVDQTVLGIFLPLNLGEQGRGKSPTGRLRQMPDRVLR